MTELYIKNMVCDRCRMAVEQTLREAGLHPESVELGIARVAESTDIVTREMRENILRPRLEALGFELLDDHRQQLIELIRTKIIAFVHYKDTTKAPSTLSAYLQEQLHQDYSTLSKLFSEVTSTTIERYFIQQRIERAKELITYDELSIKEIAALLGYSSTAYLSSQFKTVTGMTPTHFKRLQSKGRIGLDKI